MNNLKKILFCAIAFSFPFAVNGAEGDGGQPITIRIVKSKTSSRPQSPSLQQITCTYSEGCLFFNFRYPEGLCTLEVTDFETGDVTTYTFDSEGEAAVLVGELNTAHLLITTAFGHSYEGDIY